MSKNITYSFVIIALVALAASAGTLAYFTDSESSDGNTFTSGTMNLSLVDDGTPTFTEWYITPSMKPGDSSGGGLKIYNVGTIEATSMEISFSVVETESGTETSDTLPNSAVNMSKLLKIEDLVYKDVGSTTNQDILIDGGILKAIGITYGVSDLNNNGYIDLHDLSKITFDVDAPPAVSSDAQSENHKELFMKIRFVDDVNYPGNSEINNDYQGDKTELLVHFGLIQ